MPVVCYLFVGFKYRRRRRVILGLEIEEEGPGERRHPWFFDHHVSWRHAVGVFVGGSPTSCSGGLIVVHVEVIVAL